VCKAMEGRSVSGGLMPVTTRGYNPPIITRTLPKGNIWNGPFNGTPTITNEIREIHSYIEIHIFRDIRTKQSKGFVGCLTHKTLCHI